MGAGGRERGERQVIPPPVVAASPDSSSSFCIRTHSQEREEGKDKGVEEGVGQECRTTGGKRCVGEVAGSEGWATHGR